MIRQCICAKRELAQQKIRRQTREDEFRLKRPWMNPQDPIFDYIKSCWDQGGRPRFQNEEVLKTFYEQDEMMWNVHDGTILLDWILAYPELDESQAAQLALIRVMHAVQLNIKNDKLIMVAKIIKKQLALDNRFAIELLRNLSCPSRKRRDQIRRLCLNDDTLHYLMISQHDDISVTALTNLLQGESVLPTDVFDRLFPFLETHIQSEGVLRFLTYQCDQCDHSLQRILTIKDQLMKIWSKNAGTLELLIVLNNNSYEIYQSFPNDFYYIAGDLLKSEHHKEMHGPILRLFMGIIIKSGDNPYILLVLKILQMQLPHSWMVTTKIWRFWQAIS